MKGLLKFVQSVTIQRLVLIRTVQRPFKLRTSSNYSRGIIVVPIIPSTASSFNARIRLLGRQGCLTTLLVQSGKTEKFGKCTKFVKNNDNIPCFPMKVFFKPNYQDFFFFEPISSKLPCFCGTNGVVEGTNTELWTFGVLYMLL